MALFKDVAQYTRITLARGPRQDRKPVRMVTEAADGTPLCIVSPGDSTGALWALFARPACVVDNGRRAVNDEQGEDTLYPTEVLQTALSYYNRALADSFSGDIIKYYKDRINADAARVEELAFEQTPLNIADTHGLPLTAADGDVVDLRDKKNLQSADAPGSMMIRVVAYLTQPGVYFREISSLSKGFASILGVPLCAGRDDDTGVKMRIVFRLKMTDSRIRDNISAELPPLRIFYSLGAIAGYPFDNTLNGQIEITDTNTASVSFKKAITPGVTGAENIYTDVVDFEQTITVRPSRLLLLSIDTLTPAADLLYASVGSAKRNSRGGLSFACNSVFEVSIVSAEPI